MDAHQFAARVEDMEASLYRVSYGILLNQADCADAVQEALLKAWAKRDTLRVEAYFGTWLTRILINECYTMLRRRHATVNIDDIAEPAAPPDADPALHDALARLDDKYRLPLVLHYMEGWPLNDIARALHLPTGTVKTRLSRGRTMLRQALEE